jgi:hypothetical protein
MLGYWLRRYFDIVKVGFRIALASALSSFRDIRRRLAIANER